MAVPSKTGVLSVRKKGVRYGVANPRAGPTLNAYSSEMGLKRKNLQMRQG